MAKMIQSRLNAWFLRPFVSLSLIDQRNAYLIIALSLVAVIAVGIRAFLFTPDFIYTLDFGVVFLAYILSRYGWLRIASILILTLLTLPSIINLYNTPVFDNFDPLTRVLWMIFPLILASVFFSLRGLSIYALVCGMAIILAPLYRKDMTIAAGSIAFGFFAISALLLLVVLTHRNYIESLRQQELQEANEKLRESERVLENRVIERTKELNDARLEAEKANQVKSTFLASMSHELRTPLNAIINFSSFVADGDIGPVNDEQAEILGDVVRSGKHLLNLINDVLDMSKIEAGSLQLFISDNLDINEILKNLVPTTRGLLADKPVEVQLTLDATIPLISGDKQRITQVLLNLISNACKFTEKGSISLASRQETDTAIVSVCDTGMGIEPEQLEKIFQPFVQTESGMRQGGGTGLGLAISKNLVEAHGGRFWVESKLGQGSTFYVSFPIKRNS